MTTTHQFKPINRDELDSAIHHVFYQVHGYAINRSTGTLIIIDDGIVIFYQIDKK